MSDIRQHSNAADCFRLLAACFYEPEKELFVEQQVCDNLATLLENFSSEAAGNARKMSSSLSGMEETVLAVDYSALFLGPFELQAPPYGSVYLEKKREVMGETTLEALQLYQQAGLQVEEKEPADHIAIELEFMAFVHGREASALQSGTIEEVSRNKDLREKFFTGCLKPWIADFCVAVRKGSENAFYISLADCLECFIHVYNRQMIAVTEDV
jgi:TorA maturation chaperone TorD